MKSMQFLLIFSFALGLMAQKTVSGNIKDKESSELLVGANIVIKGTSLGAASDADGNYKFEVPEGNYIIVASYIGYVDNEKRIDISADIKVDFEMKADVFSREVTVTAQRAKFRETPVAFTDVKIEEIQTQLSTQDLPQILNDVPSVYSSQTGGGAGDSRINIRGFSTENIAVMINGVPVNDMENGWVYWSNWSGLGDVTSSIQVQRGLGASKLSSASIGGTVNVITKSTDSERKLLYRQEIGEFNTFKESLAYSSGLMDNNFAFSFYYARKTGDGWVKNTWSDDHVWFGSFGYATKDMIINFNATGTPQEHGQRATQHSIATYNQWGRDFNVDYGYYDGKKIDVRRNFYHKPVFDLNIVNKLDESMTLTNVLYYSTGTGGGTGEIRRDIRSTTNGTYNLDGNNITVASNNKTGSFMTVDKNTGLIDFNTIKTLNTANVNNIGAANVMRASRNDHTWFGLISTLDFKMEEGANFTVGFDGRYYKGDHFREIEDLLGAAYFLDDDNENVGLAVRKVGDIIDYHNIGYVRQYGVFSQYEQSIDDITFFLNGSINQTGYSREDFFDVDASYESKTPFYNFTGWNFKTGINLNLDEYSNIYMNTGYISKVPLFDAVFLNFTNKQNEKVKNEGIFGLDFGYNFSDQMFASKINVFYTKWSDRYYSASRTINSITYDFNAYEGIKEVHQGLELELRYVPVSFLDIEASLSLMSNTYTENFNIVGVNRADESQPTENGIVYANGIYVGDQPLKTFSLSFKFTDSYENVGFYIRNKLFVVNDHYADFDVYSRLNNPTEDGVQAWKIPDFFKMDFAFGGYINFDDAYLSKLSFNLNIFNILDKVYITDASDNSTSNFIRYNDNSLVNPLNKNHDEFSALVFYGAPRTASLGLTLEF